VSQIHLVTIFLKITTYRRKQKKEKQGEDWVACHVFLTTPELFLSGEISQIEIATHRWGTIASQFDDKVTE
jgi:hypothetical protein